MPKNLGNKTTTRKRVRRISLVQIIPQTNTIEVIPTLEIRDPASNLLLEEKTVTRLIFSQAEIEAAMVGISELPNTFNKLRTGISLLVAKLVDARSVPEEA